MQRTTHSAVGALTAALVCHAAPLPVVLIAAGAGALFGHLADDLEALGFKHRTWTHSAVFVALLAGGAWWLYTVTGYPPTLGGALVAAYTSHIIADALTVSGVPVLYPLRWKLRLCPIPLKTGGMVDSLLGALAGLATLLILLIHFT